LAQRPFRRFFAKLAVAGSAAIELALNGDLSVRDKRILPAERAPYSGLSTRLHAPVLVHIVAYRVIDLQKAGPIEGSPK
jgi:hypothetical protein